MEQHADPGLDLVLDNRKLILVFAFLMLLCGGFFVFGFIEGKRQVPRSAPESQVQAAPQPAAPSAASGPTPSSAAASSPAASAPEPSTTSVPEARPPAPAPAPAKPTEDRAVREQLEWYRSVKPTDRKPSDSGSAAARATRDPTPAPTPAAPPPAKSATASPARGGSYFTVQVGAFRQRKEAEAKSAELAARGYPVTLEPPRTEGGFFLLKVGRFEARADAAAMQLRLNKDGFTTLLKAN